MCPNTDECAYQDNTVPVCEEETIMHHSDLVSFSNSYSITHHGGLVYQLWV